MVGVIGYGGPTTEQRIEREVEFLARVMIDKRDLPAARLAEMADQHTEAAKGCLDAALMVDGSARLTFIRLAGQHATKAQIYGGAL